MSRYVITSTRVGEIGTVFTAAPSDDLAWLIAGGFIQKVQDTTSKKTAKKDTSKAPDAAETQE